jgi:hypothetical protein
MDQRDEKQMAKSQWSGGGVAHVFCTDNKGGFRECWGSPSFR